jgi:hypothetical protein
MLAPFIAGVPVAIFFVAVFFAVGLSRSGLICFSAKRRKF